NQWNPGAIKLLALPLRIVGAAKAFGLAKGSRARDCVGGGRRRSVDKGPRKWRSIRHRLRRRDMVEKSAAFVPGDQNQSLCSVSAPFDRSENDVDEVKPVADLDAL